MAESRIDVALNNAGIPDIILKPEQVKCFEYILQGYNVIAVLPMGFGKSLLYQLLPDMRSGDMLFNHVKANGAEDNCETPDYGQCKILFAHPEDILSDIGRKLMISDVFQKNAVACVIDEAHCVEMW